MAKNTISLRIALEGDKDIQAAFESLSKTGQRAAEQLSRAFGDAKIGVATAQAAERLRTNFGNLEKAINSVAIRFGILKAAADTAGAALLLITRNAAQNAAQLGQQAAAIGLTADRYQTLRTFATQSGVSVEQFGGSMRQLSKTIEEAASDARKNGGTIANGIRPAVETFADGAVTVRRFGPDYKQGMTQAADAWETFRDKVTAKGSNDITKTLRAAADEFRKMPDGAQKTTFALKLLGDEAGGLFLRKLNQGGKAFDEFLRKIEKGSVKLTDAEIEIGVEFNASLGGLGNTIAVTRDKLALLFGPAFTSLMDEFNDAIVRNQDAIREFGLTVAVEIVGVLADVRDALQGNPLLIQRGWIRDLYIMFLALKDAATVLYEGAIKPLFTFIKEQADALAPIINRAFGTHLTGGSLLAAAAILKLLGVFRLLRTSLGTVVFSLNLLWKITRGVVGVFGGFGRIVPLIARFFGLFTTGAGAVLRFLPLLLGWPGLLAAGLAAAAILIVTFWPEIVQGFKDAWAKIVEIAPQVWEAIKAAYAAGWEAVKIITAAAWEGIKSAIVDGWEGVKAIFASAWTGIKSVVSDGWDGIKSILGDGWEAVKSAVAAGWEGVKTVTADAWTGVKTIVADAFAALKTAVADGWDGVKSLGSSALEGIKTASGDVWQGVKNVATAALDGIAKVAADTWSGISDLAAGLAERLTPTWTALSTGAGAAWTAIKDGFGSAITYLTGLVDTFAGKLLSAAQSVKDLFSATPAAAAQPLTQPNGAGTGQAAGQGVDTVKIAADFSPVIDGAREAFATVQQIATEAFAAVTQTAATAWVQIGADAQAAFDVITQAGRALGEAIAQFGEQGFAAVSSAASATADAVKAAADAMVAAMERVVAAAQAAAQAASDAASSVSSSGSSGGSADPGFASGGSVWGKGTGTSDSILARLSNGEFVVRERIARQWRPILDAINSGRLSVNRFMKGIRGFANGGSVMVPGFAMGGPVGRFAMPALASATSGGPTRSLYITLDGQQLGPMIADEEVFAAWNRVASRQRIGRMTNKPGWVGG